VETIYHVSGSRLVDLLASPVIHSRIITGPIAGPDGRRYFETPTADSPLLELWEGGDLVMRLTTSDGRHWEARPGDDLPRPEDWMPVD
jgi:hypothetical protein